MWGYKKRLAQDLQRWKAAGWITSEAETKILDEAAQNGHGGGFASALGILASILLGFAVISFVAAHWQDMPRGSRLGLLLALIWLGYGAAGLFAERGARAFSNAAILFAVAAFGASIALISQMYHIDGHPPDGVLLWAIGALLSGVVLRSNPALAMAMALVWAWSGMEVYASGKVHWPFLIGWAAVTAAFLWQRWRPGAHLSGLALTGFVISLGFLFGDGHSHTLVAGAGLVAAAGALALERWRPEFSPMTAPALGYAIVAAFAGLFAIQFIEPISTGRLIVFAASALALLLGAIVYGMATDHRGALWLGYTGFSIEILAVYWKTVGSILDTSLFFMIAGLIVAALAFMAWRLAARRNSLGATA